MFRSNTKTTIQTVSRAFQSTEQIPMKSGPIQFVRGKRIKRDGSVSPVQQKIITQLSVMSARKKIPKVLKLSNEDLIRHDVITKAWGTFQKDKRAIVEKNLAKQYDAMKNAMEDLKRVNPQLFESANAKETTKRFALNQRIPTDFPPNKVWYYEFTTKEPKAENK